MTGPALARTGLIAPDAPIRSVAALPRPTTIDVRLAGWIALWTLVGLALRLAGARGGLWLDEAFSAELARAAGTPARVLFAINHDNNHHLNSLWLLAVGWGASPLAARALSIASGTLVIVVAGVFVGRSSVRAGAIAAAAFAVSPLIATYGMEARGYAPMLLAMLAALWLVDGWLADPARKPPARTLGMVAAFGVLSHLTFVYALGVIGLWAAWELGAGHNGRPWRQAVGRWTMLMGHAVIAVGAMLALVWLSARLSPDGFHFGSYRPFSLADFAQGTRDMLTFALGDAWPATGGVIPIAATTAAVGALWWAPGLGRRRSLYAIAVLLLPLAMAVARLGNANCARYYLVSGAALLLLAAESVAALIDRGGRPRLMATVLLGFAATGAAAMDWTMAASLRADPMRAIAALRLRSPNGAVVLADPAREMPVLAVNAAAAGYRLMIETDPCRPARFLFADVDRPPFPVDPVRCGRRYRAVTAGYANGLSGLHWQLYEQL